MKKILLLILFLVLATPVAATDWYADSGTCNMSACGWHATPAGTCTTGSGTALTWAERAAGDVFHANGCAAITIDVDPGANGKVTLTNAAGTGLVGGAFTLATATLAGFGSATMNTDITGSSAATVTVVVSGSTAGTPVGIIKGNITGGSSTVQALTTSQTSGTLQIGTAVTPSTLTGGSGAGAYAVYSTGNNLVTVYGNVFSGTNNSANGLHNGGSGTYTVYGTCYGNDSYSAPACSSVSTGLMVVVGNLVWGLKGSATNGPLRWLPADSNYIKMPVDATYTAAATDSHSVIGGPISDTVNSTYTSSSTLTDTTGIKSGEVIGTVTGTLASSGGGGSWGF